MRWTIYVCPRCGRTLDGETKDIGNPGRGCFGGLPGSTLKDDDHPSHARVEFQRLTVVLESALTAALARVSGLEEFQSVSRNEARTLADLAEAQAERDQLREDLEQWQHQHAVEEARARNAEKQRARARMRVRELEGAIGHAINKLNEAPLNQEPKAMRDYFLRVLQPAPSTPEPGESEG